MKKINFNANWIYFPKDNKAAMQPVHLPHDAMIHRKRIPGLKNGSYTGFYPSGDYSYVKKMFGDSTYEGKTVVLEFEGVYMDSTVFLNGKKVGGHVYGYSNFYVDLTDQLQIGKDNEIQVDVHCSQVPNARWYPGNGIYRPVNLFVGEKEHIALDGITIKTISHSPAVVEVSVETTGDENTVIETEIFYHNKSIAQGQGASCQITIPNALLWDAETPNLYEARVRLKKDGKLLDETIETFGVCSLKWDASVGLEINGKSIKLRGGCVHHDNGILGACEFEAASFRKVRIMKEAGFNAIRSAHNPMSKSMLQACDALGMYVMDEAFDTWRDNNGMYGYPLFFNEEWQDDLSKMVVKDRNHPSVVMYSIGNEISDTARPEGAQLAGEMTELCHKIDPTRPVTVCPNLFMNVMQKLGLKLSLGKGKNPSKDDITDPLEETAEKSELGGSAAINVLMMTGPYLMKMLMRPKLSEKGSGHTFHKVDIAGYNYAEQVYKGHHKLVPDRIIVGSETHGPTIKRNWDLVTQNPYIIGDFMWTGWDYLGEVGVGRIEYGENTGVYVKPYPSVSAYTGAINLIGHRELYSHLAAIVWGLEDKPYIAVQPINHFGEKKHESHYRFTDAVESWTWPGYESKNTIVEIYSTGTTIELFQNGKSLGKKKLKSCVAEYKVVYQPGKLEAVSYDRQGTEMARSILCTADDKKKLTLHVDKDSIAANGEDLAYINVSITDEHGAVKMMEERNVSVSVSGAGTLQAIGSGSPIPEQPYDGECCATYQGRMQAIVRSGFSRGVITVTISADEIVSQSVKIAVE